MVYGNHVDATAQWPAHYETKQQFVGTVVLEHASEWEGENAKGVVISYYDEVRGTHAPIYFEGELDKKFFSYKAARANAEAEGWTVLSKKPAYPET